MVVDVLERMMQAIILCATWNMCLWAEEIYVGVLGHREGTHIYACAQGAMIHRGFADVAEGR